MNEKLNYLIKNIGILTISNFSSKILVFLLVPLYTSVLSVEEYGTYDLVVSTVQLMVPILTLNIVDAVMRFSMEKGETIQEVASIGIRYICRSIIFVVVFLVVCKYFNLIPQLNSYYWAVFLYYTFYSLNQYCIQLTKGMERVNDMGIAGVLSTIVMLIFNIIFLLVFRMGLMGFFIANISSQGVSVLYYVFRVKIWKLLRKPFNRELKREMLKYCVPLILTTIGWWVNSATDRYVVTFICGVAANGLLSVAYKIPSIINTIQSIFIQAWQISAIKEYGKKETKSFYCDTFDYLNLIMVSSCMILILLSKPIGHILFAKDFFSANKYVPFLLVSSVINAASGYIGPILSAKKDSVSMAKAALYGGIINIILNIIFVYWIGIQGAIIATVIASYVIYLVRHRASENAVKGKYYNRIMISWILLIIQAIIEIYLELYVGEILVITFIIFAYFPMFKSVFIKLKKNDE